MMFVFLLVNMYLVTIDIPDPSQLMEASGGFCFEPSRMFFTSLCRMRGLPPPSHLQIAARKIEMRTCGLQIDTRTSGRATNTQEAQGSGSL